MDNTRVRDRLAHFPHSMKIGHPHPCPYLEGQTARMVYTVSKNMNTHEYQQLMDLGFRRSGHVYYSPVCPNCDACKPIRIAVDTFRPSRSQRRALLKNSDVKIELARPTFSLEKLELFNRYQMEQHDGKMCSDESEYMNMFCHFYDHAMEMSYHVAGKIVAIGLVDVCEQALSSAYFYFDPREHKRSLGVYSALMEMEECRKMGLPYWYLGYHVAGCDKMAYKNQYKPHEFLHADFVWRKSTENIKEG